MAQPDNLTVGDSGYNELERLREILFGQQARSMEQRLNDLDARQEKIRIELLDKINSLGAQLSSQLEALRVDLTREIELQESGQSEIAEANKLVLTARLEQLNLQLAEHIQSLEEGYHKADADLQKQLKEIFAELEDKKISRHAFGQLLADLGERLQNQSI